MSRWYCKEHAHLDPDDDRYINVIDIERILNQTDRLEGEGFTDDVWNAYTFLRNELQKAIKQNCNKE